jgi:tripartite-type tricarboxylate transporter receptor subunit TctC
VDDPEFKEALKKLDMAILYQTTEEYEIFVRQDFESIGMVVKALGLDKK